MWRGRQPIRYDDLPTGRFPGHCDLVVATRPGVARRDRRQCRQLGVDEARAGDGGRPPRQPGRDDRRSRSPLVRGDAASITTIGDAAAGELNGFQRSCRRAERGTHLAAAAAVDHRLLQGRARDRARGDRSPRRRRRSRRCARAARRRIRGCADWARRAAAFATPPRAPRAAGRSGQACARISAADAVERDTPAWQCTRRWLPAASCSSRPKASSRSTSSRAGARRPGSRLDDVVEPQRQPVMRRELGESRRVGPFRIEDRQDMRHPGGAMLVELGNAADRHAKRCGVKRRHGRAGSVAAVRGPGNAAQPRRGLPSIGAASCA